MAEERKTSRDKAAGGGEEKPADDGESKSPSQGAKPAAGSGAKTQRERAEQKRNEKLALIQEQIEDGTLKVRQMTPEERAKDPPRPREPKRRR